MKNPCKRVSTGIFPFLLLISPPPHSGWHSLGVWMLACFAKGLPVFWMFFWETHCLGGHCSHAGTGPPGWGLYSHNPHRHRVCPGVACRHTVAVLHGFSSGGTPRSSAGWRLCCKCHICRGEYLQRRRADTSLVGYGQARAFQLGSPTIIMYNPTAKKPKLPDSKSDRRTEQTFFQKGHTNGQQLHEKVFNINNHQGNINHNHSEIPPHTCQSGYHQ